MQILSFDCGLRNLAAVTVALAPGFAFPAEYKCYASEEETPDQFKERALVHFLHNGWRLEHAKLIDVSESLNRPARVKAILKLGLMSKASALHDVLDALEQEWFSASAPDVVAVEIQHGANAEMRAVSLAIPVFFKRSMVDTEFVAVVGGQKLKLCAAVGVAEGHGNAYLHGLATAKKEAKAAARKVAKPTRRKTKQDSNTMAAFMVRDPPAAMTLEPEVEEVEVVTAPARRYNPRGQNWKHAASRKTVSGMGARDKYEDNKGRSIKAMLQIVRDWQGGPFLDLDLLAQLRDPNITDAVLQGLWVMWMRIAPRAPLKRKRKAETASKVSK